MRGADGYGLDVGVVKHFIDAHVCRDVVFAAEPPPRSATASQTAKKRDRGSDASAPAWLSATLPSPIIALLTRFVTRHLEVRAPSTHRISCGYLAKRANHERPQTSPKVPCFTSA
jgi:hypothetical protein